MKRTSSLLTIAFLTLTLLPLDALAGQLRVYRPSQRSAKPSPVKTSPKSDGRRFTTLPVGSGQRARVPKRTETGSKQKPPKPPSSRGDDVPSSSGQNPPKGDHSDNSDNPKPETPDRPDYPDRPRPRPRPRIDIGISVNPFPPRDRDEEEKKDKEKKEKKDKKKDEPKDAPASDEPPAPPSDAAAVRPLKYDGRAYRRLIDSLLAQNRIGAALRVLELLKDQEYYDYTGSFGAPLVASSEPEQPFGGRDVVRVKKSDKKQKKSKKDEAEPAATSETPEKGDKKSKKEKKGDKGETKGEATSVASEGWQDRLEARADALLALEQQAATLRAVPVASRTPEQKQQLSALEAQIASAARDLDLAVEAIAADLGSKDPRVKRLRNAERLATTLAQVPSVAAVYTISAERRHWTVVLSPAGRAAYSAPVGSAELERKVLAFRDVLVNPKLDPVPLGRELYDVVVRPAASDPALAGATTLLWSFDGVLRYVPVSALHDGTGYLVERYRSALFNRESISNLIDQPSGKFEGVGFGVARQVGSFKPLPAVADELQAIFADAKAGGGEGVVPGRILLDEGFTEASFEQALREGHSLVHVATHFQLAPGDADDSILLFGDGSLVNVGEIRDIKGGFKGIDLLTLSACNTAASGPGADGKEVECFGTIAQERGAKAVLASLWPVNDRSTSALMANFYQLRAASPSESKAELLRRAQLELITGKVAGGQAGGAQRILVHGQSASTATTSGATYTPDPKAPFSHPFYWAPFVLIGNFR